MPSSRFSLGLRSHSGDVDRGRGSSGGRTPTTPAGAETPAGVARPASRPRSRPRTPTPAATPNTPRATPTPTPTPTPGTPPPALRVTQHDTEEDTDDDANQITVASHRKRPMVRLASPPVSARVEPIQVAGDGSGDAPGRYGQSTSAPTDNTGKRKDGNNTPGANGRTTPGGTPRPSLSGSVKHTHFASGTESPTAKPRRRRTLPSAKTLAQRALKSEHLKWIPPRLTWSDLKVVIRVAFSMWIGFVLVLIPASGRAIGQAAFLVLIVSCMIPPSTPFIQYFETLVNLFVYIAAAWAWCVISTRISGLTRTPWTPARMAAVQEKYGDTSITQLAIHGVFLEAAPSIINAVFLCVAAGLLLWWKQRTAPSPATFPIVLSCILLSVTLTMEPLFPVPNYMSAWMVFKPVSIQAGISFLCSLLVFPQSASSQFRQRFAGVLAPLEQAMSEIEQVFSEAKTMSTFAVSDEAARRNSSLDWDDIQRPLDLEDKLDAWGDRSAQIRQTLLQSLPALQPLQNQERYLAVDLSYGRLSGPDLKHLFAALSFMQVRASGLSFFFNVIHNKLQRTHLNSDAFNAQETVALSRSQSYLPSTSRPASRPASRPGSIRGSRSFVRDSLDAGNDHHQVSHSLPPSVPHSHHGGSEDGHDHGHDDDHDHDHESLAHKLHMAFAHKHGLGSHRHSHHGSSHNLSRDQSGSGLFTKEKHSYSYRSLLDRLHKVQQPVGVYESQRYMDLERGDEEGLEKVVHQLELLAEGTLPLVKTLGEALKSTLQWCRTGDRRRHAQARGLAKERGHLRVMLTEFRENRMEVIAPFRNLFDPSHGPDGVSSREHKGLFYCLVAQYHFIEFSQALLAFMDDIIEADAKRQKRRVWWPKPTRLFEQFRVSVQRDHDTPDDLDDDNVLEEEEEEDHELLGQVRKRNPDYQPFSNPWLVLLSKLTFIPDVVFGKSGMYALKAAMLTCLTTMPAWFPNSSAFYFNERGIWVTIMAQMTLAVFTGDTFSSWIARFIGTFCGIVVGLVAWYVASGNGSGNPYGMAAVCAVLFPAIVFYRIYWPGPVLSSVVFTTSVCLVIGYSYLNGIVAQLSPPRWGWDVAWRRFVCVTVGITCAWIWSYIPPTFRAKHAIRKAYANSITQSGRILCNILSEANESHRVLDPHVNKQIRKELISARSKLTKLGVRHKNAENEYSIRGTWPELAYRGLLNTLVDTMSLLAQLNHLLPQMDAHWRRALLARTRLNDPLFIGDVLAVISMTSAALKAGTPLPQITPGPLIAKYHMNKYKGIDVPIDPARDDDDAPTLVTVQVLESDDYMRYALGVSTVYALMSRLDGIVVACKTLLGENFHIANLRMGDMV